MAGEGEVQGIGRVAFKYGVDCLNGVCCALTAVVAVESLHLQSNTSLE